MHLSISCGRPCVIFYVFTSQTIVLNSFKFISLLPEGYFRSIVFPDVLGVLNTYEAPFLFLDEPKPETVNAEAQTDGWMLRSMQKSESAGNGILHEFKVKL